MKRFRLLVLLVLSGALYGQILNQNFNVTAGIDADAICGDSLKRSIFYVGIPNIYTGKVNFRVYDADMGGSYDELEDKSETRFLILGKSNIAWNILSIRDSLNYSNTLTDLRLSEDNSYDARWRTIGTFTKEQGEAVGNMAYFQLVVDGISGTGRNLYQIFISAQTKSNEEIPGIKIYTPAMNLRLSEKRDMTTQIKFQISETTNNLSVYNFDADSTRTQSEIKFENNFRNNVKIESSTEANVKMTRIPVMDEEKGSDAAIIIDQNIGSNNIQIWVHDDDGKPVKLNYPPLIAPKNSLPVPRIGKITPLSDCYSVILDASASSDSNLDELSFRWFLPDNVIKTGERVVHDFGKPGNFRITLEAKDNSGFVANTSRIVKTISINEPPVAKINCPIIGVPQKKIQFDGSGSTDRDGKIILHSWDFGDGKKDGGMIVSHQYNQSGKYEVTLTVEDDGVSLCRRGKTSIKIWINEPSVPKFTFVKKVAAINEPVKMDATGSVDSDGEIIRYEWDFGDGQTGEGSVISHAYAKSGIYEVKMSVFDDADVQNSVSEIFGRIVINEPPVPKCEFRDVVAAKEMMGFDASKSSDSDGVITEYFWDMGDGNSHKGMKINHQYTNPGTYNVKLKVTDNTQTINNLTEMTRQIRVNEPPVPDAGGNQRVNTSIVNFDATKSSDQDDPIIDYSWDFGDGNIGNGSKISHVYTFPGKYEVTLTVTDASKTLTQKQSNVVEVIVNALPVADAGPEQIVAINDKVKFNGGFSKDTDGKIASYTWEVEDGVILNGKTVEYQYSKPGIYQVKLSVKDDFDAEDVHYRLIVVNTPPVAEIVPIPRIAPMQEISLDGSLSYDRDGKIQSAVWDLGDGSPVKKGLKIKHAYKNPGRYNVILTITDDTNTANNTTTATQIIAVNFPPEPNAGKNILACNQTVSFTGTASSDADQDMLNYFWDFGDGTSGGGVDIAHTYQIPGIYPVTLKVDDGMGLSNSQKFVVIKVHVNSAPVSIVQVKADTICAGEPLLCDGSKSFDNEKDLMLYQWDFGDGSSAEGINPIHYYKKGGNYLIRLKVSDDTNLQCNSSISEKLVHIIDAPVANAGPDQEVCANKLVQFDGSKSIGGGRSIKSYEWDFGDGEQGVGVNPTHAYEKFGTYLVRLFITVPEVGLCENTSESQMSVKVISAPTISMIAKSASCVNEEIKFDASSSKADNAKIVEYAWTFGDGTTGFGAVVTHKYAIPGKYKVNLKIRTDFDRGCNTTEANHEVEVNSVPRAVIQVAYPGEVPAQTESFQGYVRSVMIFNASKSTDSDGFIHKYIWKFDDGSQAEGVEIQHQYTKPGEYFVSLSVIDNSKTKCNIDLDTIIVDILDMPRISVESATIGFINEPVQFTVVADKVANATNENCIWTFGDGETMKGLVVKKAFAKSGKFQVQVKCGNFGSSAHQITIDELPVFTVLDKQTVDLGESVKLTPTITNPFNVPIKVQWDLGDGSTVDQSNVDYIYKNAGDFIIKMKVYYKQIGNGQPKIFEMPVKVLPIPDVIIDIKPQVVYEGGARDEVSFTATCKNFPVMANYYWDFGDGATANGKSAKHQYNQPGTYSVTLTMWDATRTGAKKYTYKNELVVNKR